MEKILIACGIFQEEIEAVLREAPVPGLKIIWLEVGLHDNVEKMEETLAAAAAGQKGAAMGLLYGLGCLPSMKDFAASLGLKTLAQRNCLAAMVGDGALRELEKNRTLLATAGWIRKMWLGRAGTALGWRADDYRINFGRYDRIVVLDAGLAAPLSDDEIIASFDLVGVPIEVMECSPDYFRGAVKDLLDSFL